MIRYLLLSKPPCPSVCPPPAVDVRSIILFSALGYYLPGDGLICIHGPEPSYPGTGTIVFGDWNHGIRGLDQMYPKFETDGSKVWKGLELLSHVFRLF